MALIETVHKEHFCLTIGPIRAFISIMPITIPLEGAANDGAKALS